MRFDAILGRVAMQKVVGSSPIIRSLSLKHRCLWRDRQASGVVGLSYLPFLCGFRLGNFFLVGIVAGFVAGGFGAAGASWRKTR